MHALGRSDEALARLRDAVDVRDPDDGMSNAKWDAAGVARL